MEVYRPEDGEQLEQRRDFVLNFNILVAKTHEELMQFATTKLKIENKPKLT